MTPFDITYYTFNVLSWRGHPHALNYLRNVASEMLSIPTPIQVQVTSVEVRCGIPRILKLPLNGYLRLPQPLLYIIVVKGFVGLQVLNTSMKISFATLLPHLLSPCLLLSAVGPPSVLHDPSQF